FKDSRTSKLVNLTKNIIIISLSIFIAGFPSFFGVLAILNIESGSEGLGWALGSAYRLFFSKALPIFLVMVIGYLGLRVAANIVPELVKIYFSRSNQEEIIDKEENDKRIETFAIVLRSILRVFIVTIAVFTVLQIVGVPITSLVATFSVIAIAVGLGTQSVVKDIVQGLLIISENHLRKGDVVNIANKAGLVEDINLRRILLRDLEGALHVIPNSNTDVITNFTSKWSRVHIEIPVTYEEDIDKVIALINEVGRELGEESDFSQFIDENPEVLRVNSFDQSSLSIKIMGVTKPGKQWLIKGELLRRLKIRFDKEKIPIHHSRIKVVN
ncbi:MAG: hypothetical protein CL764_05795, partial [Chloroflexi bacterium]|nr:hypothetical protein [Chloroflexota bacterium]